MVVGTGKIKFKLYGIGSLKEKWRSSICNLLLIGISAHGDGF